MRYRDDEERKNEYGYRLHEMQMDEFELELTDHSPDRIAASKLIVLGAPGVGKSSLIRRFVSGQFTDAYEPSPGMKVVAFEEKGFAHKFRLEIWDTPNSTSLAPLVKTYYSSMQGALVVYDPSLPQTLEYAKKLMEDLPDNTVKLLVANKSDLKPGGRDELSVSAKTGENVADVFFQLQGLIQCF